MLACAPSGTNSPSGMENSVSSAEARMLAALDEPALVKVLRFWEQHGTAYMAMPL